MEQTHLLKDFSIKYKVYVVLKGAYTRIATPSGNIYFNSTGNPGLAKGGSGDILTGVITSLLAQGYSPLQSSLMGAYIHGLSADFALQSFSEESMIASDIVEHISAAYKSLKI
jgi:hydroxyethylthiazole kinase-like uncharacterized protein yjeF